MGAEQGDYIEYGGGSGDIGAGGDFSYGYGAGVGGDYGSYDFGDTDFYYGYGAGETLDLPDNVSPGGDAIAWGGDDFNYGYGAGESGGTDLVGTFFDYYSGLGYDDYTALQLAVQDASAGSILTETYEQGAPQNPPDLGQYYPLPYNPGDYNYWQTPPYVPTFPDLPAPSPPLPQSPASSQPNLPPACAAGTYHPYPIGHPQQNICVPFPGPQATAPKPPTGSGAPASAPKPPAQQSKPPAQQSKPPAQQPCMQGYYRAPNGQCLPIPRCTTPGTAFDVRTGRCVPSSQAALPGCPPGEWFNRQSGRCELIPPCTTPGTVFDVYTGMCVPPDQLTSTEDIFGGLKNIPWWLWLAAGGLFLLSRDDDKGRTTTVRYRRAS